MCCNSREMNDDSDVQKRVIQTIKSREKRNNMANHQHMHRQKWRGGAFLRVGLSRQLGHCATPVRVGLIQIKGSMVPKSGRMDAQI